MNPLVPHREPRERVWNGTELPLLAPWKVLTEGCFSRRDSTRRGAQLQAQHYFPFASGRFASLAGALQEVTQSRGRWPRKGRIR